MTTHNFYIYSNCDFTSKSAAATRMRYYARAISNESNRVYLLSCCSTNFKHDDFLEAEPHVFIHKNKRLTRNLFSTISFLKKLTVFSKSNKGTETFILYPYPHIFLELLSVLYLIFIKRKNVYYELNEVRKYTSDYHETMSFKRIYYSLKKIKNKTAFILLDKLLPFFTGLICISTNIETYGQQYNKNTFRIPILTDPNITTETSKIEFARKGSFNIGFSGSILPSKENLISFISGINKLLENNYDIAFNLCGFIKPEDQKLLIEDLDIHDRINYYGNLGKAELSAFLNQQDLLVLPRGFSLQNKYGFSTKLSDYLNHQKVILATDISDNGLYITDGFNGFIVAPDNEEMMYEKLKYIIENFEEIKAPIIANAYKTSKEEFDYRLFRKSLPSFLKSWQNHQLN